MDVGRRGGEEGGDMIGVGGYVISGRRQKREGVDEGENFSLLSFFLSFFVYLFLSLFVPSFRSLLVLSGEGIAGEEGDMSDLILLSIKRVVG